MSQGKPGPLGDLWKKAGSSADVGAPEQGARVWLIGCVSSSPEGSENREQSRFEELARVESTTPARPVLRAHSASSTLFDKSSSTPAVGIDSACTCLAFASAATGAPSTASSAVLLPHLAFLRARRRSHHGPATRGEPRHRFFSRTPGAASGVLSVSAARHKSEAERNPQSNFELPRARAPGALANVRTSGRALCM